MENGIGTSYDLSVTTPQLQPLSDPKLVALGGVPREQKMLRGHPLRVMCHRVHFSTRRFLRKQEFPVLFSCYVIAGSRPAIAKYFSSFLLSSLELSDTHSLSALNTSPPRNCCTFLRSRCFQIKNCTAITGQQHMSCPYPRHCHQSAPKRVPKNVSNTRFGPDLAEGIDSGLLGSTGPL